MTQGVAFRPTDEQRRTVKAMAGFGVPHEGIAILLEIDPKTLRKYFQTELDRGSVEATAKVAQSLFHMATVGQERRGRDLLDEGAGGLAGEARAGALGQAGRGVERRRADSGDRAHPGRAADHRWRR